MKFENHGTGEQIELYSLGRLSQPDADNLADHLLICGTCQEKFDEIETFSLAMHRALREQPVPEVKRARIWFAWTGLAWNSLSWMRSPSFALAGGMAIVLLASIVFSQSSSRTMLPVASIQLSAMRGETVTMPAAKEMYITLADAPKVGGPFRVEMVDATGHNIWSGNSIATAKGIEVKVRRKSTDPGSYFIRLYSANGSLLHEYGVRITE